MKRTTALILSALTLCAVAVFTGDGLLGQAAPVARVHKIQGNEVIISGKIGENLTMGVPVYVETEQGIVVLQVYYPMQTMGKCRVTKGAIGSIRPGMAVYPGRGPQRAEAAMGQGEVRVIGGMSFVFVRGGEFLMGSPESEGNDHERPQRRVSVDGFAIGLHEVSQEQYKAIMDESPSYFIGEILPVEKVTWDEAMEFCRRFGTRYGVKARLPYEVEWEYACRAGSRTRYYWGDDLDLGYCWYEQNSTGETQSCARKDPNALGLYDMIGNVYEWCMDWYSSDYYATAPAKNPRGPAEGTERVIRGGAWSSGADDLRSAMRTGEAPGNRFSNIGFRVVIEQRR
ncbi:MAG TPA: SUMF1/EgtB/PvdO family nonheme iron enzyme [Spirochaetota bacterium]|nr:SUMF1/EgtB/PvdO family nonheme iron enzyme [Spirochaetota bacterium]